MSRGPTRIRLHQPPPLPGSGTAVRLDEPAAHHVRTVLRARPGTAAALFNDSDGEWLGRLQTVDKRAVSVVIDTRIRPPAAEPGPILAFALLKKDATDLLVQKATELGAAWLVPVITRHTQAQRVNTDRLGQIARSAAEQCERLSVPQIAEPIDLFALPGLAPGASVPVLVADESGAGAPLADVCRRVWPGARGDPPPPMIVIGPEGGFAQQELDALAALPVVYRFGMGPRILRAETAALAALAGWQAIAGDGRAGPPRPDNNRE